MVGGWIGQGRAQADRMVSRQLHSGGIDRDKYLIYK